MATSACVVAGPELHALFARAHDDFEFKLRLRMNAAAALEGVDLPAEAKSAIASRKLESVRAVLHMGADVSEFVWVAIAVAVVTSTAVAIA